MKWIVRGIIACALLGIGAGVWAASKRSQGEIAAIREECVYSGWFWSVSYDAEGATISQTCLPNPCPRGCR